MPPLPAVPVGEKFDVQAFYVYATNYAKAAVLAERKTCADIVTDNYGWVELISGLKYFDDLSEAILTAQPASTKDAA